jgi:DNA-binding GntR family transcriptional regulator
MQVVRHIREEIISGRLIEGAKVSSARQIAAEWEIALATATKVLATLRAEGLVRGVPGVGTVVVAQSSLHRSARDRSMSVHRTGRIYPPGHYSRVRSAELVPAPERVAGVLGLNVSVPVIRRRRTTYDGTETPVSTSVSWFDGALASSCPALLVTEWIRQGTIGYIEAQTGRAVTSGYDQVAASRASAQDADELVVEPGSPVLLTHNRWVDDHGTVLEYGESTSPPNRWALYEYIITIDVLAALKGGDSNTHQSRYAAEGGAC